jgi:gliding motility-associated-like protein
MPSTTFTGTPSGIVFNWANSNTSIGLGASGSGNVPSFTATNKGNNDISGTITVTPVNGGCTGTARSYVITVKPLDKDIFVPNVFSPNRDGKNDILYAYGNYVQQLEMRIFNQWGEQVAMITDIHQGWDGTQRGKAQPVGVYMYVLRATMTDGRVINKKGSITLIR